MNQKRLNFFLPLKLVTEIKLAAEERGLNMSEFVRQTLWCEIDRIKASRHLPPLEIEHMTMEDMRR